MVSLFPIVVKHNGRFVLFEIVAAESKDEAVSIAVGRLLPSVGGEAIVLGEYPYETLSDIDKMPTGLNDAYGELYGYLSPRTIEAFVAKWYNVKP